MSPERQETPAARERSMALHLPDAASVEGCPARLDEPVGPGLNNLFILRLGDSLHLGRKLLDDQGELGSRLTASMLLGPLLKTRHAQGCLRLHYTALSLEYRQALFMEASHSREAVLHFPFPVLDERGNELVAPPSYWADTQRLAHRLDRQEAHFRKHCLELLTARLRPGALVHDPACSTGTFIASLAKSMPHVRFLGGDRCAAMIGHANHAHQHPNVHFRVADAASSSPAHEPCDALILRFLNAEVMRQRDAVRLFERLQARVRHDGIIVLFGHTPVLVPVEAQAKRLGLKVTGTIGTCPGTQALFQFFTLERA